MKELETLIFFENSEVKPPVYKKLGDSGCDVHAFITSPIEIKPFQCAVIPTGIRVAVEQGYEIQVRSRSGLAANDLVFVLNSPGTIDSEFRGVIGVILYNANPGHTITVENGDRIAQLVCCPIVKMNFNSVSTVEALGITDRGEGGFGHTGVSS